MVNQIKPEYCCMRLGLISSALWIVRSRLYLSKMSNFVLGETIQVKKLTEHAVVPTRGSKDAAGERSKDLLSSSQFSSVFVI